MSLPRTTVNLPFLNRRQAGGLLAGALVRFRGMRPLVLAIPRGAVPIAKVVAEHLGGELDIVLAHKLGAPGNPEYAIGAIDEAGNIYLGEGATASFADEDYIRREADAQLKQLRRRRDLFTPGRKPVEVGGRQVIVVDDGLATGATMIAALRALRAQSPAHLVCAVPVASAEALRSVEPLADEVVCLAVPRDFGGVGNFYYDFAQVEDEEVVEALRS